MIELLKAGDCVNFLLEIIDSTKTHIEFKLYEVVSWKGDKECTPSEKELYIKGVIKWDGCSHLYFGEKDGYLHLCGKHFFDKHCEVMKKMFEYASKNIEHWDKNTAE